MLITHLPPGKLTAAWLASATIARNPLRVAGVAQVPNHGYRC
jgi:hypothetical protein